MIIQLLITIIIQLSPAARLNEFHPANLKLRHRYHLQHPTDPTTDLPQLLPISREGWTCAQFAGGKLTDSFYPDVVLFLNFFVLCRLGDVVGFFVMCWN